MKKNNYSKLIIAVILLSSIALFSFFYLSNLFSSASFHTSSIEYLDSKKSTVVGLTGAVTIASIGLSAIPGDTFTPMAGQLASLTNWMLLISMIVIMEKYLLTITGFIAFKFMIPIACACYIIFLFTQHNFLRSLAIKLVIFGLAIFLVVPSSVKLCKIIESTQLADLQETVETVDDSTISNDEEESEDSSNNNAEDISILDIFNSKFWSNLAVTIKNSVISPLGSVTEEIKDKVTAEVSNFIDKVAVLVVTTCIIPLLVMITFGYLLKMSFGIAIDPSPKLVAWLHNKNPKISLSKDREAQIESKS